MSKQRTRDTGPELAVRRELHALGLRFRIQRAFTWSVGSRTIRRTIDIVLPGHKIAVEVHGCYWHGCPECSRAKNGDRPNSLRWAEKFARNRARDADTVRRLTADGWRVVTIWEHEDPREAALRVAGLVAA